MALFSRKSKPNTKSEADSLFAKGQWSVALPLYERLAADDPDNLKLLRRVADLRARLGRKEQAAEAYREVASRYAQEGFLLQAIAIYKILLRLDPEAQDVGVELAALYAKRGITTETPDPARKNLPEIPLFSDLEADEFSQVIDRLVSRSMEEGEVLFRQGDPGDSIFVVTGGSVRVSRGDLFLAQLGEGSFFGEGAFFSREPRNADVAASTGCELLEMRREAIEDLMERYPGVAEALTTFYRQRVLDGVLASSPLFHELDEAERKRVARFFQLRTVDRGEAVVREGEPDRSLFLIKRGCFRVTSVPPGGEEPVVLADLGPGCFFGEVALVGKARRTATVEAVEDGEVLVAGGEQLDPVLADHPELREMLERAREERAADTVLKFLGRER